MSKCSTKTFVLVTLIPFGLGIFILSILKGKIWDCLPIDLFFLAVLTLTILFPTDEDNS